MTVNTTLQNLAYALFVILGVGFLMYIGSSIIVPFIFGVLLAVYLYPIDKRLIKIVKFKPISISLSFLSVLLPLSLIAYLFTTQMSSIVESLPEIKNNMQTGVDKALSWVSNEIPFLKINRNALTESTSLSSLKEPLGILGQGFISSSSVAVSLALTFIYSFLILYYRRSIRNFIVFQFEKQLRPNIRETLTKIKEIVQAYIGGLAIVIILLSILNSLGLWLIGIEYPLFWGTLAGLLAVIPYVGTALGGLLPFLFALATADHNWQPIAIVIYYAVIQFLEGNVITPKIVGDKVNVNPLFAVLSLVFFGSMWGVGGIILALPIIGVARIILSQFESTQPIAVLMSSEVADKAGKFKKMADS